MRTLRLGKLEIDLVDYASQGNAILGIRGSGKTYTATFMAEQLLEASIPFVAFDPIGAWRYLKVPGRGPGFKVVVAGGEHGDLPLTPESAPAIVRAAMKENIPLILDLYTMELSKADWRRIVETCVRILLFENKKCGLRHVFIEEAAEFVPQKIGPNQGTVYAEVEKLVRMGGNASLGVTLINQRAEEVNKAVLELCDLLFLHRQKGRRSLQNLEKWLSYADSDRSESIIQSITQLENGQCWIWPQGSSDPQLLTIPEKSSFHPDRRRPELEKKAKAAADVGTFVEQLKGSLQEHLEKAKENDPDQLKKRIRALEKELSQKPVQAKPEIMEVPVIKKDELERLEKHFASVESHAEKFFQIAEEYKAHVETVLISLRSIGRLAGFLSVKPGNGAKGVTIGKVIEDVLNSPEGWTSKDNGLPSGARKMLIALAQRSPLRKNQLAVRAGLAQSGTFSTYLSKLKTAGFIQTDGTNFYATNEGRNYLGDFEPLPTGRDLYMYWTRQLPLGANKMLAVLMEIYPESVNKTGLAQMAGLAQSGTMSTYISKLKTLELITQTNGLYRASEELIDEARRPK